MSNNNTTVAIDIVADSDKATQAFDDAAAAAKSLGSVVEQAGRDMDRGASSVNRAADAADNLDSKSAAATGALGALSSGFELVGLGKYAEGMQAASMATDFFSGVGQSAKLVMDSIKLSTLRAKAATVAQAVATRASAAATKAAAIAQRIFNLAMAANPVGLVIVALSLLVAGFVLAYKKSETFRAVVQGVMKVVRTYIDAVVTIITTIVELVRDKAPAVFRTFRDVVVGVFDAIKAPIQWVVDKVQWIIDKLPSIHLPDLNPFGRASTTTADLGRTATPTYQIAVTGALDPDAVAKQIDRLLARRAVRVGF